MAARTVFAFEVKSEDGTYCETFTSPEDGIILIEGLRVGKYTVTEVKNKASEDYIIPDGATVEIKADETAEVSFFNEKPEEETPETPETPDNPTTPSNPSKPVPQTGDDYNLYIWIGVLGAAVVGSGIALFLCAYKKKGTEGQYRAPQSGSRRASDLYCHDGRQRLHAGAGDRPVQGKRRYLCRSFGICHPGRNGRGKKRTRRRRRNRRFLRFPSHGGF